MSEFANNSESLKAYRTAAAELHTFSLEVEKKLEEVGMTGELHEAKEALSQLSFQTKEFEKLRAKLSPLDRLIAKYAVVALNEHTVSFVLPKGVSRIEALREAQELSRELHELNPEKYWRKQAIRPDLLTSWESESDFTRTAKETLLLRIDGNVKDSTKMAREEQEANGWNNVTLPDLAVAHALFYLLTAKDLFQDNVVRAASDTLRFDSDGLGVGYYFGGNRNAYVSASRSLSAPN